MSNSSFKLPLVSVAIGLAITGLTMLHAYPYCLNGPARGFPLAVTIPPCEASVVSLGDTSGKSGAPVVDLARLGVDVLVWGCLGAGVQAAFSRRKRLHPSW